MRRRPTVSALLAVGATVALAGCGITDPYGGRRPASTATSSPAPTSTPTTSADPAPERGGTITPAARAAQSRLSAGAGLSTPQAALERYARLYVNWSNHTVAAVQDELATISLGQAHAQALQAAASYARDQTLQQSGVSNSGELVAIAESLTNPGQWVLVTSEETTGKGDYAGLPATLHVTYAQVAHTINGYVVSQWAPQN